jgi:hypothetical protein
LSKTVCEKPRIPVTIYNFSNKIQKDEQNKIDVNQSLTTYGVITIYTRKGIINKEIY